MTRRSDLRSAIAVGDVAYQRGDQRATYEPIITWECRKTRHLDAIESSLPVRRSLEVRGLESARLGYPAAHHDMGPWVELE